MKVFVSHKDSDSRKAAEIAATLRSKGHEVYLDLIDNDLGKNGSDLADHLRVRLGQCDSLLAVISSATKNSWWVPWEIGVATEKLYPLSSYQCDTEAPPEYLRKWPILKNFTELSLFAEKIAQLQTKATRLVQSERKSVEQAKEEVVAQFHRELKQAINQR